MLTIISPAKSLDFGPAHVNVTPTTPSFTGQSAEIIKKLRTLSSKKVGALMGISKDLAELNVQRYREWSESFTDKNSKPALLTFSGDVYRGFNVKDMKLADLNYAQEHLRILSGLHGLLRPLDRIQPYRLEMGTSLPIGRKKNLYAFWQEKVTAALNETMKATGTTVLINLASAEYSSVVNFDNIEGRVITPVFKDLKNGEYKVVMTWAKLARGMMAGYIIRNRIDNPELIKGFPEYHFSAPLSSDNEWVFTRG